MSPSFRSLGAASFWVGLVLAGEAWAQGSVVGAWESTTPGLGALATLDVQANKWNATVKATAPCGNGVCDWGTAAGKVHYETVEGSSLFSMVTVVFESDHATTWLLLIPKPQAKLEAQVVVRYKGNDKRFPTYHVQTLRRRPPPPKAVLATATVPTATAGPGTGFAESCVHLDPTKFVAKELNGKWWLMCGQGAMASFRTREDAQRAAQVATALGFDQRCQIGSPRASLYYYLKDRGPPKGAIKGEDCSTFKPTALVVTPVGGRFALTEAGRSLLDFPTESEAKTALAMIRHHGFTSLCYVGRPDPGLTYLKR